MAITRTVFNGKQVPREILSSTRNYFVSPSGSDSNNGLTSGTAFKTIQYAIDTAAGTLDMSNYNITINVMTGTYNESIQCKQGVGAGTIQVVGYNSIPYNIHLTGTGATAFYSYGLSTKYKLGNAYFTSVSGANGNIAVDAEYGSYLEIDSLKFGGWFYYHLQALFGGIILALSGYTIERGVAVSHISSRSFGGVRIQTKTITLANTPAWGASFCDVYYCGIVFLNGNTYAGTGATGKRYIAELNGVIQTLGGTLPGDAAGTTATGGQYA